MSSPHRRRIKVYGCKNQQHGVWSHTNRHFFLYFVNKQPDLAQGNTEAQININACEGSALAEV
jgi:hypothetical protein